MNQSKSNRWRKLAKSLYTTVRALRWWVSRHEATIARLEKSIEEYRQRERSMFEKMQTAERIIRRHDGDPVIEVAVRIPSEVITVHLPGEANTEQLHQTASLVSDKLKMHVRLSFHPDRYNHKLATQVEWLEEVLLAAIGQVVKDAVLQGVSVRRVKELQEQGLEGEALVRQLQDERDGRIASVSDLIEWEGKRD